MSLKDLAVLISALAMPAAATAEPAAPLAKLKLASEVYRTGLIDQDPLLVLAAVRLARSVDVQGADGSDDPNRPGSWQTMLTTAFELAKDDPSLLALAEDIEAERSKGVTTGPVYAILKIAATTEEHSKPYPFSGGDYAEIYVEGAQGIDLNLLVHDQDGQLVCSDLDASPIAYCGWNPSADGRFTATIRNAGSGGEYSLITN